MPSPGAGALRLWEQLVLGIGDEELSLGEGSQRNGKHGAGVVAREHVGVELRLRNLLGALGTSHGEEKEGRRGGGEGGGGEEGRRVKI